VKLYFTSDARKWPIKLILTSIGRISAMKFGLGKMISKLGVTAEYGPVHTALLFGPVVLEWNDTSLCVPLQQHVYFGEDQKILFAFDLVQWDRPVNLMERARKVCEVICYWNKHINYNVMHYNCQDFVNAMVQKLEIPSVMDMPKVRQFFATLQHQEMVFYFQFRGKKQEMVFRTHADLDEQYYQHVRFQEEKYSSEELRLLKAFDRAFWFQLLCLTNAGAPDSELVKYKPAAECPHGDPTKTGTVMPRLDFKDTVDDAEPPLLGALVATSGSSNSWKLDVGNVCEKAGFASSAASGAAVRQALAPAANINKNPNEGDVKELEYWDSIKV